MAGKSDFYDLHEELVDLGDKLEDISHIEKAYQQRHEIHHQIIESYDSTLWMCASIKIFLAGGLMLAQIILIKNAFKKND